MDPKLISLVRGQLDLFKEIMIKTKEKGTHPTAMLLQPSGEQFMIVMEWHNEQEAEIVLNKLAAVVFEARIMAVVLTMTNHVTFAKTNQAGMILMSTLYVPTFQPYTIGVKYEMVENEPVFGDEVSSDDLVIQPYQIPNLWPGIADSGTIH